MQNQQTQNGCSVSLAAIKAPQLKVNKGGVYRGDPRTEFSINTENQYSTKQPLLAVERVENDPISGSETTGILLDFNTQESASHWQYGSKEPFAFFVDAKGQLKSSKTGTVTVSFYQVVEKANGQKTMNMTGLTLKNGQIASRKSIQVLNQPVATIELRYANPTEWDRMTASEFAASSR